MPGNRIPSASWIRWFAVAGVVALVMGVAASIVLLATDGAPSKRDLETAKQVEAHLAGLDTMISGTVAQQSAGAFMDHWAQTARVKQCMAEKGERYRFPFIDPYAAKPEYTGVGDTWSAPLMSAAASARALASARYHAEADRFAPFDSRYHWDEMSPNFRHAFNQCEQLREHYQARPNDSIASASDLAVVVGAVSEKFGKSSAYDSCMLDAGYDVYWDDFGGYDAMQMLVQSRAPSLDVPVRKLPETDEWAEYLQYEQKVLDADYDCRASKYVELMGELVAPLDEFESSHQTEIAQLQTEWKKIVADATSHGWTPPRDGQA